MRRSLIVGFIVLLVCCPLVGYSFNLLLSSNKSLLLQRMEQSWGRKISAREVRMTFVPDIGLRIEGFVMADDPVYSTGAFLTADELQVSFHFLPLFRYQLLIKDIILRDMMLNIIRESADAYNFSSLGLKSTNNGDLGGSKNSQAPAPHHGSPLTPISLIRIFNGTIRYLDQKHGADLTVNRLDLQVVDRNYENSFQVELAMAVFAREQNLQLKATVGPVDFHSSVRDLPVDAALRIDRLDMGKLRAALPTIKKELPKALDLRGVYSTQGIRFKGTFNRPSLKGQVEGTDASFRFD